GLPIPWTRPRTRGVLGSCPAPGVGPGHGQDPNPLGLCLLARPRSGLVRTSPPRAKSWSAFSRPGTDGRTPPTTGEVVHPDTTRVALAESARLDALRPERVTLPGVRRHHGPRRAIMRGRRPATCAARHAKCTRPITGADDRSMRGAC